MPRFRIASVFLLIFGLATPCSAGEGSAGLASYYPGIGSGGFTAAHRSLPFGTQVRVTRVGTGRSVIVRINDRGPFIAGRIIDVSRGAAEQLQMISAGVARVTVEVLSMSGPKRERLQVAEGARPRHLAKRSMKNALRRHQGRATRDARSRHRRHHQARAD
jgi:rare lipoprotein A